MQSDSMARDGPSMLHLGRRTSLAPDHMTPIKIRGKRGQKARLRVQRERRAAVEELDMTPSLSSPPPEAIRSKLESLPTEILESIFLYSKNLELPRASLALGTALSSTGFKHIVLRAYLVDPYLEDDETRETGSLQSALLRCRWVDEAMFIHTLHHAPLSKLAAFFQNPSPSSMHKVTDVAPHNALLGPGCPISDTSTPTIASFVNSLTHQSERCEIRKWEWVSHSDEKFSLQMLDHPGRIWLGRYEPPGYMSGKLICNFQLANGCEIPTKVLHGPWSETRLNFLQKLINAWAGFDWETSNNGEVAETSFREAIVQGNTSVLKVMLTPPVDLPYDSKKRIRNGPYHSSIPVTQEHLRLAILDGGCNTDVVNLLLRRGHNTDLRLDDSDLLDWAIAKNEEDDERGHWLLCRIRLWEVKHTRISNH
ncbi:MAG: hypothetical protein Q9213_006594 [Squamulea squamosa]